MTKEAHLRKDRWAKGEWIDKVIYGLLADEWDNRSEPFPDTRQRA